MCNQEFIHKILNYYNSIKEFLADKPAVINYKTIYLNLSDIKDLNSLCTKTVDQFIDEFIIYIDEIISQVSITYYDNKEEYQNRLEEVLNIFDNQYYIKSNSLISDYVYDMYKHKLDKELLGNDIIDYSKTEKHLKKMYSLNNVYSEEELEQWLAKNNNPEVCIQYKIDGLSINILYQNGNLVKASTRGNGIIGENVTENILTIDSIPKTIDYLGIIEVRGEIYLKIEDFNRINSERVQLGLKEFSSPRNAASGSLKLKDVNEVKNRNLEAIFYDIGYTDDESITTHNKIISLLKFYKFKTVENFTIVNDENYLRYIKEYIKLTCDNRDDISYDIDGMVIKINNRNLCEILGYSDKFPKWATAYKFKDEEAVTTLLNVEYQVGKTGNITPVAVVEPTSLSNCIINRCTLHNKDEIKRLGLHIGDKIVIVRSAEVIPKILRVSIPNEEGTLVEYPLNCPECGKLLKDYKNSITKCINPNCKGILKQKLYYFVSKQALDIDDFGPSLIDKLVENDFVSNFTDIYNISRNQLLSLERMGDTLVDKILYSINKSKSVTADILLQSFSIQCIGEKTAKALLNHFLSIEKMIDYFQNNQHEIEIKGVNKDAMYNIIEWCNRSESKTLVKTFKSLGFHMEIETVNSNNKTVLITGTLKDFKRNDLQKLLESKGYKIASSVSKNLDYLIVGDNPGSKLEKAQHLNINIILENELNKFLEN